MTFDEFSKTGMADLLIYINNLEAENDGMKKHNAQEWFDVAATLKQSETLAKQRDDLLAALGEMVTAGRMCLDVFETLRQQRNVWTDGALESAEFYTNDAINYKANPAIAAVKEKPCTHPNEITQHTGDGTPVSYCPDCGRNEAQPRIWDADESEGGAA